MSEKLTNQDKLKWYILFIASLAFGASIIVKLFKPTTEINTISTVFVSISGLVLGSSAINFFKDGRKD